jgi:hypothetical protein
MAIAETDYLVRGTGICIIVIFLHTYLMAEKGTEYELTMDHDEESSMVEGGSSHPKLSTQQKGPGSQEKPVNEIQDDDDGTGVI